jgi:CubicO group peptidase (beta-lactamase class C family)
MSGRLLTLLLFLTSPAMAQMTVLYPEMGQPVPDRTAPFQLKPVKSLAEVGITDPFAIYKADQLMEKAIATGAFPGARVIAAKNGLVFYDKAFGHLTYDKTTPVTLNTIYDLASLTKVVSTTLAVMRLHEQGKIVLDKTLGDYLPMTLGTDKAFLRVRDVMLHQAGLKAFIPFYKSYYDSTGALVDTIFHTVPDARFNIQVAQNLYMRKDYRDTIWHTILTSPLDNRGKFVYSDLDYYFLAAIVEKVTGKTIDRYVAEQFYIPMGLKTIGYLPLQFLKKENIAPTENDVTFRHQVLQGFVHDPGAAMFGGVAGHAGVFASAGDVAAIFQMLMADGNYNGKVFFKKETIKYFTAYGSPISRRGLGFDKPNAEAYDGGPCDTRVSGFTFGHQGFTGTCAWADPANGVVFVFLSNRVYPNAENGAINRLATRTTVQGALYEALNIPDDLNRANVKTSQLLYR